VTAPKYVIKSFDYYQDAQYVCGNYTYYIYYVWQFFVINYDCVIQVICRFQWPRGLRRRSSAARPLRSWLRIPPRAWMFVL
jgi:hypothetical protein